MTVLAGAGPTGDDDDGYDTRWLDLRGGADDRCRSAELLEDLLEQLQDPSRAGAARAEPVRPHLLDLGCGTGAMQRWCDGRLTAAGSAPARWTLMDPDERLLGVAAERAGGRPTLRRGTVADVSPGLLDDVDAVVCSALLDVLPPGEVEHLVVATATAGVPVLACLTVTGEVALSPPHPDDPTARAAVDRAATAGGACGPRALELLAAVARRLGVEVRTRDTSWHLGPGPDATLLGAWGAGYVAAALGHEPTPDRLAGWARDRSDRLASGGLRAVVAHRDVLLLPVPAPGRA